MKMLSLPMQNVCSERCCCKLPMIILLNHHTEYSSLSEIQKLDFVFNFLKMNMLPSREIKSTLLFKVAVLNPQRRAFGGDF